MTRAPSVTRGLRFPRVHQPRTHATALGRERNCTHSKRMDCRSRVGGRGTAMTVGGTSSTGPVDRPAHSLDLRNADLRCRGETRALPFRGVLVVVFVRLFAGENLLGDQAGVLADRDLDLAGDVGIFLEKDLGILAALADA